MKTQDQKADYGHIPVLPQQTVELLTGTRQGACRIIDGTLGCGGHSALLLRKLPQAELLGIDRDANALARAEKVLAFAAGRVRLVQTDFASIRSAAQSAGWNDGVDMILLDLGVSSPQIDDPERGFSFRHGHAHGQTFSAHGKPCAEHLSGTGAGADLPGIRRTQGGKPSSPRRR